MEPQILGTEDPKQFRNRKVRIIKKPSGLDVRILEPEMSFPELMKYRTQHQATGKGVHDGISSETGYEFANLGISGVFTITIGGDDYVLAAEQKRPDIGDLAAKLISGYVDSEDLKEPFEAMKRELSEEVLPVTQEGRVMRFRYQGESLPKAFSEHFQDFQKTIDLVPAGKYEPPNLEKSTISIEGYPIDASPTLYFQVPTNSAQLVYSLHLNQGGIDFRDLGVSLHHSEDSLNREKGLLEKKLHQAGILLIRLEDRDLTDQVYHYSNGEFIPVDPKTINLSEAFAPKYEGIVEAKHISLSNYLRQRN